MEENKPENNPIPSSRESVSIRTMQSDIESLKQTGGAHPMPETVEVATHAPEPIPTPQVPAAAPIPVPENTNETPRSKFNFVWIFWILGIGLLFLFGYFILPRFL